jgi:hypothetical protein
MDEYQEILKHEFGPSEDNFITSLRIKRGWDKDAFRKLVIAMGDYCKDHANTEVLERTIAHGIWYMEFFVENWTTRPNFPRKYTDSYYKTAYEIIHELAYWYFTGQSPYMDNATFERKIKEIS